MLKRVHFNTSFLCYLLVAPQIAITLVFFIWPASQALYQSFLIEDAFGLSTEFVWFDNFTALFGSEHYLKTFVRTAGFSLAVTLLSMSLALLFAAMADRMVRTATTYRTLLIWPYAVAPVVAGALWMFMFDPTLGIIAYLLDGIGYDWNHRLNGNQAMALIIFAATWKQISYNLALGKIIISLLSAFAIVYFRFPLRMSFFWLIFITLMLPVEVRILPTFAVVANLGMLDSYFGLTVPLIASATATFMFRQVFLTIPDELLEAARMDGAGPFRFFKDILLPVSRTNIAALFVILFIYGWNQYLWPLLITTDKDMYTIVMGIKQMLEAAEEAPEWHLIMMTTLLAMLPPVVVVVTMQKVFIRGLTETEKQRGRSIS